MKRANAGACLLSSGLNYRGSSLQLCADDCGQAFERGQCGHRHRNGLALAGNGHRVLVNAVDTELKMQMGSCGPARGAYQTNGVALRHTLTDPHIDFAQVSVHRFMAIAVL